MFFDVHALDSNSALISGITRNQPPNIGKIYYRNSQGKYKMLPDHQIANEIGYHLIYAFDSSNILVSAHRIVYQTTNMGVTWDSVLGDNYGSCVDILFSSENENIGKILFDANGGKIDWKLFRTYNKGLNWSRTSVYLGSEYRSIWRTSCFTDSNDFYIASGNQSIMSGKMTYSLDAENWWDESFIPLPVFYINKIAFKNDKNTGLALGRNSTHTIFFRTTNHGISWNAMIYDPSVCWDIKWIDGTDIVYVLLENKIIKSTDAGLTWNIILTADLASRYFYSFDFKKINNKIYGWLIAPGSGIRIMKMVDSITTSNISNISSVVPEGYELKQNYPNPFNPETNIEFSLPKNGNVELLIYDINGKEILKISEYKTAGKYNYSFNAKNLPSGIYFYTLSSENFRDSKKMILLK
ncbi:MAG TPA: hypothetical protein DEP28_01205 [Bacteroidetes bacterium]|nr:hypothetical protein [Bacteroidota bacterium]